MALSTKRRPVGLAETKQAQPNFSDSFHRVVLHDATGLPLFSQPGLDLCFVTFLAVRDFCRQCCKVGELHHFSHSLGPIHFEHRNIKGHIAEAFPRFASALKFHHM